MAKKKLIEIALATSPGVVDALAAAMDAEPYTPPETPVPQFVLRADVRWHLLGMIALASTMRGLGLPRKKQDELDQVVRQFELYEEAHRG